MGEEPMTAKMTDFPFWSPIDFIAGLEAGIVAEGLKAGFLGLAEYFLVGQAFRPGCVEKLTVLVAVRFHLVALFG